MAGLSARRPRHMVGSVPFLHPPGGGEGATSIPSEWATLPSASGSFRQGPERIARAVLVVLLKNHIFHESLPRACPGRGLMKGGSSLQLLKTRARGSGMKSLKRGSRTIDGARAPKIPEAILVHRLSCDRRSVAAMSLMRPGFPPGVVERRFGRVWAEPSQPHEEKHRSDAGVRTDGRGYF